jgi:antitoxin VapB
MALNVKNAETEKLVRELARRRGKGITEVLTEVLRREVEQERKKLRPNEVEARQRRIEEIVKRHNSRPLQDNRPADEIIGYNEHGHFD